MLLEVARVGFWYAAVVALLIAAFLAAPHWKAAVEAVHRKWRYAWFHRRKRKPDFRGLWIVRINAAARELGVSYSRLIAALDKSNIALDRKILSDLAISDPAAFKKVVETAQASA